MRNIPDRKTVLQTFSIDQTASYEVRQQCIRDRRNAHITGALWEGEWSTYWANKPRLDLNPFTVALNRITAEYRQNRVQVDFRPKDGMTDALSETLDGLLRADQEDSQAGEAYDNAFSEGIAGGIGAWRLCAEYEDEFDGDNDHQRIRFEPIYDADINVIWDSGARRYDKSDAKRCYVLSSMPVHTFNERFPGHDPASWPRDDYTRFFDWYRVDSVTIAEYYEVVEKTERFAFYESLTGEKVRVPVGDTEARAELEATGHAFEKERRLKSRRVHKWIMSGSGILEDCGLIAGRHIPIVPFYARRFFIDGIERCEGHIRHSVDAARVKNMAVSRVAEISAVSPYRKPIFLAEQMAGHANMWATDHIDNNPFLLVNKVRNADGTETASGPLAYTEAPDLPPAVAGLVEFMGRDMEALLGNAEAGEQIQSNVSAQAVELAQTSRDMRYAVYMDNFAKSMRRCGQIWLSMAQEIYVEEGRSMKTVTERGDIGRVTLMEPGMQDGVQIVANDIANAEMEVITDVGPAFTSRRDSTVRSLVGMMQFAQGDPEVSNVLLSTALMNMEGEGLKDTRDWFRQRLLRIGAAKPTPEEQADMEAAAASQNAQPDPQQIATLAFAEREQAEAAQARANTLVKVADAGLKEAQTAKVQAETISTLQKGASPNAPAAQG